MNLSFPGARPKISFLRPVSRENFANALGQTCIHDLRLRLKQDYKISNISICLTFGAKVETAAAVFYCTCAFSIAS